MKTEDIAQRDIIITKPTLDILRKEKCFLEAAGLYTFYYYTAIWQKTNQPKATTSFAAKGTNSSESKVRKLKKILIRLHLIEDIVIKNDIGQVTGHFIKVRFYQTHPNEKPQGGKAHKVVKHRANAYRDNKRNAYRYNIKVADKSGNRDFDLKCSNRLHKILIKKRKIFRTVKKSQWVRSFKKFRLESKLKKKYITEILKWYIDHFGEEFVPKAYSAKSFCDKFAQIEDAMERYRTKDITPDSNGYKVPKVRKVKKKRSKK